MFHNIAVCYSVVLTETGAGAMYRYFSRYAGQLICFTICLCISPDFDGLRYVYVVLVFSPVCFTVCLCPDREGYDMFHDMFVH